MKYALVIRNNDESKEIGDTLRKKIKGEEVTSNPDIVIAIGGDGTILKAVHSFPKAITFGVHTGHLGFYANYSKEDVDLLIDDINNGNYKIDLLDSLCAKFTDKMGNYHEEFALNEFTIVSPPRTLRLDVFIDDEYFERFRGTGLSISTPYGSTAYNKSLDGSVIDTSLSTIQITEIAGINSNTYRTLSSPLVLSSDRKIRLEAKETKADIVITADHISYNIYDFNTIDIISNKKSIKMGYHHHESFLKRINRTFIISKD